MIKNTNKNGLFQPPLRQFILVQSKIMTQFVQKSRVNLIPKCFVIALRKMPKIFQKQNNLRRHRNISLVRKLRSREQTQSVRFNSIRLQAGVRLALECHRQFLRARAQRLWQRRQGRFDLNQRQFLQFFPIRVHSRLKK